MVGPVEKKKVGIGVAIVVKVQPGALLPLSSYVAAFKPPPPPLLFTFQITSSLLSNPEHTLTSASIFHQRVENRNTEQWNKLLRRRERCQIISARQRDGDGHCDGGGADANNHGLVADSPPEPDRCREGRAEQARQREGGDLLQPAEIGRRGGGPGTGEREEGGKFKGRER